MNNDPVVGKHKGISIYKWIHSDPDPYYGDDPEYEDPEPDPEYDYYTLGPSGRLRLHGRSIKSVKNKIDGPRRNPRRRKTKYRVRNNFKKYSKRKKRLRKSKRR